MVTDTGPKANVPVQLLSPPPFFTKTAFPEVVLKLQVPVAVMPPAELNVLAPVNELLVMVISPEEVIMEKSPKSVVKFVLKVVGLNDPLLEEEDCVRRLTIKEPLENPVVEKLPEDWVLVPPAPPISAPPVPVQFKVMVFPKLALPM